jgi:NADH-quinone oxidoreductase subunit N
MTYICFLVLSAARAQGIGEDIASYRGFARSNPRLGLALTIALASLAGLPLTAGFVGKFFVIFATVLEGYYAYLAIAVIGAATGFYYYFKVILALYAKPETEAQPVRLKLGLPAAVLLGVLVAAVIVLGVYPNAARNPLAAKPEKVAVVK